MCRTKLSLVLSSVVALLATIGVSNAVTTEAVRDIGSAAIPTCSCRHFGPQCVHVTPQGTSQCRVTFADTQAEAQALRDQRCRDLHGGVNLVWESFRCTTRDEARELRVRTQALEREAQATCGDGNYVVMGGWDPEYRCFVSGTGGTGGTGGGTGGTGGGTAGTGASRSCLTTNTPGALRFPPTCHEDFCDRGSFGGVDCISSPGCAGCNCGTVNPGCVPP